MRLPVTIIAIACATGCHANAAPEIDRVELARSGWVAERVVVTSNGVAEYHVSEPMPGGRSETFKLKRSQLRAFLKRLEPYRVQAEPYDEESAMRFLRGTCPKDVPPTYDAGAMYVRWIGPSTDVHVHMDFGCDSQRFAQRNKQMHDIFESLPLPR